MDAPSGFKLKFDPFRSILHPARAYPSTPFRAAYEQVLASLDAGARLVVLLGAPGVGKSLLLRKIELDRAARGRTRRWGPGEQLPPACPEEAAVLLVDDAERAPRTLLSSLSDSPESGRTGPALVLAAARSEVAQPFGAARPTLIRLSPLDAAEAAAMLRHCCTEAGRPDLFTDEAVALVAAAARGSPELLRLLGRAALGFAAGEGVDRVEARHAALAVGTSGRPPGALASAARSFEPEEDLAQLRPLLGLGSPSPALAAASAALDLAAAAATPPRGEGSRPPELLRAPPPLHRRSGRLGLAASVAAAILGLPALTAIATDEPTAPTAEASSDPGGAAADDSPASSRPTRGGRSLFPSVFPGEARPKGSVRTVAASRPALPAEAELAALPLDTPTAARAASPAATGDGSDTLAALPEATAVALVTDAGEGPTQCRERCSASPEPPLDAELRFAEVARWASTDPQPAAPDLAPEAPPVELRAEVLGQEAQLAHQPAAVHYARWGG